MSDSQASDNQVQKQAFIQARKKRNIAVGLCLLAFIFMLYFITMFKLGSQLFI